MDRLVSRLTSDHVSPSPRPIGECDQTNPTSVSDRSFASQDGLDVHLNPVLVDCPSWLVRTGSEVPIGSVSRLTLNPSGKSLLKKNIIRHRDRHCRLAENESIGIPEVG
jgi:hypothetical protein